MSDDGLSKRIFLVCKIAFLKCICAPPFFLQEQLSRPSGSITLSRKLKDNKSSKRCGLRAGRNREEEVTSKQLMLQYSTAVLL